MSALSNAALAALRGVNKKLENAYKSLGRDGAAWAKRAQRAVKRRAGALPLPLGGGAVPLKITSPLTERLEKWARLLNSAETVGVASEVGKHLAARSREDFNRMTSRLPTDFFVTWVDDLRSGYASARNATDRSRVVQRAVDELNEILGLFHPGVLAKFQARALVLATSLRANKTFTKEFELLSEVPDVLRFVKAAGVKGSKLPTRAFVDGLPVMRMKRLKTGEECYLMLGDIQVKSGNVRELAISESGGVGQFARDRVRRARGTGIAIISPEARLIRDDQLVDPTDFQISNADVSPVAVGQRGLQPAERAALKRQRIVVEDVPHDVPTATSREMTLAVIESLFPKRSPR
jgi:hypothetical protein